MTRPPVTGAPRLSGAAPVFAALGDETRLGIVARLCADGPQSITRLTESAMVSRQAITKHLHALAQAGLASGTREGREQVWRIRPRRIAEVGRTLEQISRHWDDALERLRASVESGDER